MNIGFVPNAQRSEAVDLLGALAGDLTSQGHRITVPQSDADGAGRAEWAVPDGAFADDLDLVVVLGGDGTVLRAVQLTEGRRVPILGINLGHLGYLAEVESTHAREAVRRVTAGEYRVEHRTTVVGTIDPGGRCFEGLNEIVLMGGDAGRLAEISCAIDGADFTVYRCDALLVATPTGSTAYALSAGGPIVSPGLPCLILVPVAAHNLFNRALVLRPDEAVVLRSSHGAPAAVAVDGRAVASLGPDEQVRLHAGAQGVPFVRLDGLDFLGRLREKFGLTTPGRHTP